MITVYEFPKFRIENNKDEKSIATYFEDGSFCKVYENESDIHHGKNLGISGIHHKLAHELAHGLIALINNEDYSQIVYAQANNLDMPHDADFVEHQVFALTYFTFDAQMEYVDWWQYLGVIQNLMNPYIVKKLLTNLLQERETHTVKITYK